jgi:hypothetical protein
MPTNADAQNTSVTETAASGSQAGGSGDRSVPTGLELGVVSRSVVVLTGQA